MPKVRYKKERGSGKIGQHEIMELLEANPNTFYTMRELSVELDLSHSSICRASRSVTKREDFVTKFDMSEVQVIKRIGYIKNE
jgi:hypothetical protein